MPLDMALNILFMFVLALHPTLTNTAETKTHVQIEDTAAYTSALNSVGCSTGCCRDCIKEAINSFRTAQSCDPVDSYTCICMDKPLSAGLRTAISDNCYNHCGMKVVPAVTQVLVAYCSINDIPSTQSGGPASTPASTTSGESLSTTLADLRQRSQILHQFLH